MSFMRLWSSVVRSSLLARLFACVMIGVMFVPAAEASPKRKPKVLYVHSNSSVAWTNDVQSKLNATTLFATVDTFDAGAGTPTLAQLSAYDAVMVSNVAPWANAAGLGTVMQQYVDAGGGVVQSIFTTSGASGSNLAGTWTAAYNGITFSSAAVGTATLGTIANQNHPIMIGVMNFDGGSGSYRPSGTALTPGATLVASWSDGKPLVVVGPKINRCDLGFWAVSGDGFSGSWLSNTDGVKMLANALLYVIRPRVLIAGAPGTAAWINDVQTKIRSTELVGMTDTFNAGTGTPTLAQLQTYDAVLVFGDSSFQNPTALGNALADYVDAGGGVVQSVFSNSGGATPTGRWAPTYNLIAAGSTTQNSVATLGAAAYPSHPALNGVASFNGGSSSYRPTSTSFNAGAFKISSWSDGKTLVAASTKFLNRIDLGFYPPSSSVRLDFWDASTGGAVLMANALVCTAKPYIGVGTTLTASYQADVVNKLIATRRFSAVASLNVASATPTAADLLPFHGMLIWADGAGFADSTTLGSRLADQIDFNNGGVVTSLLSNTNFPTDLFNGRWNTDGFDITPRTALPGFSNPGLATLGSVLEPNHPIAAFVRKFDGGTSSWRQTANPLLRGRRILQWSDGKMLASVHNNKRRADLGYVPVSNASQSDYWNQRSDGTWITANAIDFVARYKPCPGDFNGDGLVDDSDFVLFAGYYDALLDPRGDLNGDGITEDSDFVIFAGMYDALVCP